jgi:uncharacterized protein GlcG (DUF336 family)
MALTLAEANRIVAAAVSKAQEMNIRVSAAVCDAGGRLIAFNRMDGAIWAPVSTALRARPSPRPPSGVPAGT